MNKNAALTWIILFLLKTFPSSAQCNADISISTDGIGNYLFTATNITDSSAQHYWLLNNDTLPTDSNQFQATVHIAVNDTYRICLFIEDTVNLCSFDTCQTFAETNAEYIPLLDSVNIWHMFESGCPVKVSEASHQCSYCTMFYTGNDTSLNGISYKKLFNETRYLSRIEGLIREDINTRKIFFRPWSDTTETLLYDFGLQQGDSVFLNFLADSYFSGIYRLDSIKSITIQSVNRKVFFLGFTRYTRVVVWIEGIGSLTGPVYSYIESPWGGCSFLECPSAYNPFPNSNPFVTCFEHVEQIYFDSCAYENALQDFCIDVKEPCYYYNICGAVEEIQSLSSFSISPNPAINYFDVTLDVKDNDYFTFTIRNMNGKTVAQFDLGTINPGTYSKQVNIQNLTSGFYIAECKSSSGASMQQKLLIQN